MLAAIPTRQPAGLLAAALLALALAPCAAAVTRTPAEVVRYTRTDACDQPFAHPPVDAETLHDEAFEWTQHTPLQIGRAHV